MYAILLAVASFVLGLTLIGDTQTAPVRQEAAHVRGPGFEAWDFKFGLLESEDADWTQAAIDRGALDNRELSCRVTTEKTAITSPLPGRLDRYGFTFEYKVTRPDVEVEVNVHCVPTAETDCDSGRLAMSSLQGRVGPVTLRDHEGRFCDSHFGGFEFPIKPSSFWFEASIEGQSVGGRFVTFNTR